MIPVTILGFAMGPMVALYIGSTQVVVFNALCLLAFKAPLIGSVSVVPGKRKNHRGLVARCNKPGCKLTES